MNYLTIITPTFNRGYIIENLYNSLLCQSNNNFTWMVIDDGSTDDTERIIDNFKSEGKIEIVYYRMENGGKHRAVNQGVRMAKGELIFIVDSDDYLLPNAVEDILQIHKKYKENSMLCGYSFLRCDPNMEVIGDCFPKDNDIEDFISVRINKKVNGDKAEVFRTECLLEYPFLEIPGEKFLSEDYSWIKMAEKYKMLSVNIPIYVCEYREDGLSHSFARLMLMNPIGVMNVSKVRCSKKCNTMVRVKAMANYIAYGRVAGFSLSKLFNEANMGLLFAVSYPLSVIVLRRLISKEKQFHLIN